jgi:hypothetical protein
MSVKELLKIVAPPGSPGTDGAEGAWSRQLPLHDLLEKQRQGDSLALYGCSFDSGSFMIHSVLVPQASLGNADPEVLSHWSGNPFDSASCGEVWGGGKPARVEFNGSRGFFDENIITDIERLIFGRSFEGRGEDQHYYEIAQFLSHAHGLHWTPERRAWCRLDNEGDVEDIVRWTEEPGREGYGRAVWIDIQREVLEMQMSATETALMQMFESFCFKRPFSGWGEGVDVLTSDLEKRLHYRAHSEGAAGSWIRGVQFIVPRRTAEGYGAYLQEMKRAPKVYESFITHDWKNNRVTMVSCSPDAMASYFERESPLPYQTSPVFFRGDVLDKYKADPRKYTLEQRSITCRNSWHLQTYDVNEQGQVHTYIKYLGDLPRGEQVYWKAFNEAPKGGISERARKTDFEASWDHEPDPLMELQELVRNLNRERVPWFKLRELDLVNQLHYPLTTSDKAWGDTLTTLAMVVTEGLEKKYFEKLAKERGAKGDPQFGSILWL